MLTIVATFGCRIYMDYSPQPMETTDVARKAIAEILDQQPGVHAAIETEVYDDKFSILHSRANKFFGTSQVYKTTIFYASIGEMRLSHKGSWFAVTIMGRNLEPLLHVYIADRASSDRFLNALETMRRASVAARPIAD